MMPNLSHVGRHGCRLFRLATHAAVAALLVGNLTTTCTDATAAEPAAKSTAGSPAGHSFHGEAFNEGPRQAASLIPGMGALDFPATTESPLAQRYINQGVAQLHGFWYFEAERSFRQAAMLDPKCAICLWGLAMANDGNRERAQQFIAEATQLKFNASRREQLYIESMEQFCRDEDDDEKSISKKDRALRYTKDLETIVEEFPTDIEAKAFLAVQLWKNARADVPIVSHVAIDSVLQDIFDMSPTHPAHHYRIHLWDNHKPERALQSAAMCGPSLPGIAHMWHMPGHIYSRLHRYQDAAWQQEASARVDHAHMMRDRVLPDQIHNFAHNNEWLIRNLLKVGRVSDALALARNMLQLPRHPKYNTVKKGSTKYGRQRLLLTYSTYRLWGQVAESVSSSYIEPTGDRELDISRLRDLVFAAGVSSNNELYQSTQSTLEDMLTDTQTKLDNLEPPAKKSDSSAEPKVDAKKLAANLARRKKRYEAEKKRLEKESKMLERAIAAGQAAAAAEKADWTSALRKWKKAELKDNLLRAEWLAEAGKLDDALELTDREIKDHPGEVLPPAVKSWILYHHKTADAAREAFEETAQLACFADLDTPLLARLAPLAAELDYPTDWRAEYLPPKDLGQRPSLDSLGPMHWQPYIAPSFAVESSDGDKLWLADLKGKPTIVIFYLGFGCLHCVEQLHEFSPRAEEFRESGIDVIAISSEEIESLNKGLSTYSNPLDIPLHADPTLTAFKDFRCYDDFEQQPLHGTFLIDPNSRVLWQDISYEPFMDSDFLLAEAQRLLELHGFSKFLHPAGKKIAKSQP